MQLLRWGGSFIAAVSVVGLVLAATGPVRAASASDTIVRLPDGTAIDVKTQASVIEASVDEGTTSALMSTLLANGLEDDAAALLVYAARYQPLLAPDLAVSCLQLAASRKSTYFASLAMSALAAEPAVDVAAVKAAVEKASLPQDIRAAAVSSLSQTAVGADGLAPGEAAAEEEGLDTPFGDEIGRGFLPDLLRIGAGSSGAAIPEPSPNGGAS